MSQRHDEKLTQWRSEAADKQRKKLLAGMQKHGEGFQPHETVSQWSIGLVYGDGACMRRYLLSKRLAVRTVLEADYFAFGTCYEDGVRTMVHEGMDVTAGQRRFREAWADRVPTIKFKDGPRAWKPERYVTCGEKLLESTAQLFRQQQLREVVMDHNLDHCPVPHPVTGAPVPGFKLSGKLDMVDYVTLEKDGEEHVAITDFKALATTTKPEDQLAKTMLSAQLNQYAYMAMADSLLKYYPGVGKLVSYMEAGKNKGEVSRSFAWVNAEVLEEILLRAYTACEIIRQHDEREADGWPIDKAWPKNLAACFGPYGPCEMLEFCRPELFADPVDVDALYVNTWRD